MTRIKTNTFTKEEKKILLKLIQKRHPKVKIENISLEYEHEVLYSSGSRLKDSLKK